jgi:NodT family efflux transporter outer membrane factor (OMF) lipoprotein
MRRTVYIPIIFILLLGQGCVSVPSADLAAIRDSVGCEEILSEALGTGEWETGNWPDRDWWKRFEDPTLSGLIESALESSPTLMKAESNLKSAYQAALQVKSKLFPTVTFDAEDTWQHVSRYGILRGFIPQVYPPVLNETKLGLNFSYEFDFWGKNRALFKAALGRADAEFAERLQAELVLTTSIAYTYSEMQLLLKKRGLLQKMEDNLKEISAIRVKRKALDNALIQLQAVSNSLDTAASLVQIDQMIQTHIHKLKALSGQNQDAVLNVSFRPLNPLVLALPDNLSLDLIARRPDLIAQKARVEAASKQISAAKTDFYPNINLSAFFGLDSFFWDKLFFKKSYNGSIDPAIHLPIFTAGRLKAHLSEKVDQFNEAVYAYDELILKAAQEVADAITNIHRFHKEAEVRDLSLQAVQRQLDATEKRMRNALDSRIAYLNAYNALLEMELTFTEVEYGKQLAAIDLIRVLGGGFHE